MSLLTASRTIPKLNLQVRSQGYERKFKFTPVCTPSLHNFGYKIWSLHVADLPRSGKECTEIVTAREGRAKVMFLLIKYAKFVALSVPSCRRS